MGSSTDKNPVETFGSESKGFVVCHEKYFAKSQIKNMLESLSPEGVVYSKWLFFSALQATRKLNKCAV
jgi:hypothetical protein